MKASTKIMIGKRLIPANILSMVIVIVSLVGVHVTVQSIDCNSDSNMTGYNQPPEGNNKYPSDTIDGRKAYCHSQVKQGNDFVSQNTDLAILGYSAVWIVTISLILSGKKDVEQESNGPTHGTLPKGYGP